MTNDTSFTVAAGRFYSSVPGCPPMADAFGTLFAMTGGRERGATAAMVRPVVAVWQATLEHAAYVWFTGTTVARIPWNQALYGYFRSHFRLVGLAGQPTAWPDVPRPGLYARG